MNVSVVIPVYNKAPYLRRALESVFAQSHPAAEILVVDDGSVDGSGDIVRRMQHPRLRLITQENRGVSAARNRGIGEAAHPLIAFLDADDEWLPEFLRASVAAHRQYPALAASFSNFRKGLSSKPVLRPAVGAPRRLEDYFAFTLSNAGAGMWSSSVVASRNHLETAGGFPVGRTHGEDLDTWMRLAWSGPVAFVPEVLSIYHEECGASAAGASNLDVLPTFRQWRSLGQIPARLVRSSFAFAVLCRHRTAFLRAQSGQKQVALQLYRDLPAASRFGLLGLAGLVSILSYSAGKYAFYAAETLNRRLGYWQWRARC